MEIALEFVSAIVNAFEANKRLADRAVEQVPDDKLHVALDANTNSIAVIMKHVAGNLLSRWTDFLTSDGEKPWRNRDEEFVDRFGSRAREIGVVGNRGRHIRPWHREAKDRSGDAAAERDRGEPLNPALGGCQASPEAAEEPEEEERSQHPQEAAEQDAALFVSIRVE